MPITYVGASAAMITGTTSATVAVPTGYAENDVLILIVGKLSNVVSTPSGWTPVNDTTADTVHGYVFYKIASASESSVNISSTGSTYMFGLMLCFRGVDTSAPIDVNSVYSTLSTTSIVTGSTDTFTTTEDGCMVVHAVCFFDSGSIIDSSNYSSWANSDLDSINEFFDYYYAMGIQIGGISGAYGIKSTAGAVKATTATADSSSNKSAIISIALKPPYTGTDANADVPVSEVSISAPVPTVSAIQNISVSVPVSDVSILLPVPTISAIQNASATVPVSDTIVEFPIPSISTAGVINVEVSVPVSNVSIEGLIPVGSASVGVEVPVSNIPITSPIPVVSASVGVVVPVSDTSITGPIPVVSASVGVAVPVSGVSVVIPIPGVSTSGGVAVPVSNIAVAIPLPSVSISVNVSSPVLGSISISPFVPKIYYAVINPLLTLDLLGNVRVRGQLLLGNKVSLDKFGRLTVKSLILGDSFGIDSNGNLTVKSITESID